MTHVRQVRLELSLVKNDTGRQLGQAYHKSLSAESKPGMQLCQAQPVTEPMERGKGLEVLDDL